MCRYNGFGSLPAHYICFRCRKGFKARALTFTSDDAAQHTGQHGLCPECHEPMTHMGYDFKVPPQQNTRQWRKVERLVKELDFKFFCCGCDGPGFAPRTLGDVNDFVERYKTGHRFTARWRAKRWKLADPDREIPTRPI